STDSPDNFWYGPNALPPIASTIVIEGRGGALNMVIGTSPRSRFFFIGADPQSSATPGYNTPGPGNLTLRNVALYGARQQGGASEDGGAGAGMGGAIFNQGSLTLDATTMTNNVAQGGSIVLLGEGGGGMAEDSVGTDGGGMGGAVPLGTADAGANADPI